MDPKIAKLGTVTNSIPKQQKEPRKRVKASATARKQIVYVDSRVPTHVKFFLQCILVCHDLAPSNSSGFAKLGFEMMACMRVTWAGISCHRVRQF